MFTIGYGGRKPGELVDVLRNAGVRAVVDVRLRPDRASLGTYARARASDRGIEALLRGAGIEYVPLVELGNPFIEIEDWRTPYRRLLDAAGEILTARIDDAPRPFALLCAERDFRSCHRELVADYLSRMRGWTFEHL